MSNDALRSVCGPAAIPGWPALPPLCASTIDTALVSNNMEYELRALVMQHRRVSHTYRLVNTDISIPTKLEDVFILVFQENSINHIL